VSDKDPDFIMNRAKEAANDLIGDPLEGGHEEVAAVIAEAIRDVVDLIREGHALELHQWEADYRAAIEALRIFTDDGDSEFVCSRCGGWPELHSDDCIVSTVLARAKERGL
jgi:hypothetical protein